MRIESLISKSFPESSFQNINNVLELGLFEHMEKKSAEQHPLELLSHEWTVHM
jgi:hypothetical protein